MLESPKAKLDRAKLIEDVTEILETSTNDPCDSIRAMGHCLIKLADCFEGLSGSQAVDALEAARLMLRCKTPSESESKET